MLVRRLGPRRLVGLWLFLIVAACAAFIASLLVGSTSIPTSTVLEVLAGRGDAGTRTIVLELRLPRAVAAFAVGGGLAAAGAAYQALFRNALADPYIIGASGGASVGAVLVIVFGGTVAVGAFGPTAVGAFLGCLLTVGFVYVAAAMGRRSSSTLLLFGVIVGTMLGGVVWLLMALADENLTRIIGWLMGGFGSVRWDTTMLLVPVVVLGVSVLLAVARPLDALAQGDDEARSLGLSIGRLTLLILLTSSAMVGLAVATAGAIGFIGLAAPQAARLLVGASHARVIPTAVLIGGLLLLLADLVARSAIPPLELPVGVVTALIGGPLFLLLLRKQTDGGVR